MILNKKKVFALALAVCLIAILSMSTLAWFTDEDSVTNDFMIAGSDSQNPDDVFSVDVWEEDPDTGDKDQDGFEYEDILPGDILDKTVNVENTGAYDQYVRVTVTVSQAHIWQEIFGQIYVPLNMIATDLNTTDFTGWSAEYNADNDELIYVLYYNDILDYEDGQDVANLFNTVAIPGALDRYQAAEMAGGFQISVKAEAVQTENVGINAQEAFATVGMYIEPGERMILTNVTGLENALTNDVVSEVVLSGDLAGTTVNINYDIKNKTIDAAGQSVNFVLTGKAENVVFTNIQDAASAGINVDLRNVDAGSSVTVKDSYMISGNGTSNMAIGLGANCDLIVDNCEFTTENGIGYGMYRSSGCASLTITNSTFTNFADGWVVLANGTTTGNVKIDGCTFTDCSDGIFKTSVGGGGLNGLLNGDFTFTNNTLTNCAGHDGKEVKLFDAKVSGIITVDGNTRDGAEWIPGADQGIVQK